MMSDLGHWLFADRHYSFVTLWGSAFLGYQMRVWLDRIKRWRKLAAAAGGPVREVGR